jgi:mRNA interferase RelE/StbE
MTYRLIFKADAKKEWDRLDSTIRKQFKNKLVERIAAPRVESLRLNGM